MPFPYFHQLNAINCGPTCLKMVAKHSLQFCAVSNRNIHKTGRCGHQPVGKKILTFWLLFFFLTVHFCYGQEDTVTPVILIVDHRVAEKQTPGKIPVINYDFYYHDIALHGHPVNLSADTVIISIKTPVFLLHANEEQTPFLIYPGEEVHIQFLDSGRLRVYIPNNTERTNELNFFPALIKQTDNLSYFFKPMPFIKKAGSLPALSKYETLINSYKKKRLNFLYYYSKHNTVSSGFAKIAATCIYSAAVYDSLQLYCTNKDLLNNHNIFKNKVSDKIQSVLNESFSPLLYPLKSANALVAAYVGQNCSYTIKNTNDFNTQYQFINNNFSGAYKNFLLFKTIYDAKANYIDISQDRVDDFYNTCENSDYKNMVWQVSDNDKKLMNAKGDAIINMNDDIDSLSNLLRKFSGNLILLDFWASWCAPCRQEMQYSKKLEQLFKGKPIQFVYLSIDENKSEWLKANKKEELGANSYLLLHPTRTETLGLNNVVSVPKYILIDKDGKIISDDAPRPSDPVLEELVKRNL